MRATTGEPVKKRRKIRVLRSPAHRLRSVWLVLGGLSAVKVGRRYGDSSRAVSNWVQRFKKDGAKGLEDAPHPGRPSTLNLSQERKLGAFVAKAGTGSRKVIGGILAAFIKQAFGATLTRRQCERILKRLNA